MKVAPIGFLLLASMAALATAAASPPATRPAPDLSTPRAALLTVYTAMRAGEATTLKSCLIFDNAEEADVFDANVAQVCAPLRLMHAMEARFGEAGRKPFDPSIEKSIDSILARAKTADIAVDGDTAVVGEKKVEVNPNAETELSGVTLKKVGEQWKVVASTFPDSGGAMSEKQLALMRSIRDALVLACQATIARLEKGEFTSPDEAYAAYQAQLQPTARDAAKSTTQAKESR